MSDFSFNVLSEPWIPVLDLNGRYSEKGILDCLEHAHRIREVRSPAPIIEFGLYRLLVAFVLDALISVDLRPKDEFDLQDLIQQGRFDMDILRVYAEKCGDVFDLFHSERPFLQTKMENEPLKPLAAIFPVAPSGTNAGLWHHKHEDELAVPSPEAARMLTTIAPFMISGGSGLSPSINGAPPLYSHLVAESLYECLLFNIPLRKQAENNATVAWMCTDTPGKVYSQVSTLQALTWRPRKIQLFPELDQNTSVIVRKMRFSKGDSTEKNETKEIWRDPSVAYEYEMQKNKPLRPRFNRPIWRDYGSLFLLNENSYSSGEDKVEFRRSDVMEQILCISHDRSDLKICIYGMRVKDAKVFEWIKSLLVVPFSLAYSTRLGAIVCDELKKAEESASFLRRSIKELFPREAEERKVNKKKKQNVLSALINRSEKTYWQALEPLFHELTSAFGRLEEKAADNPELVKSTTKDWRENVRRLAFEQFESASKDMDADSDALERMVHARMRLGRKLADILVEVER